MTAVDNEEQDNPSKDTLQSGKEEDTQGRTIRETPTNNTKTAAATADATMATNAKPETDVETGYHGHEKSICTLVEHDVALKKRLAAATKRKSVEAHVLQNYVVGFDALPSFPEGQTQDSPTSTTQHYQDMMCDHDNQPNANYCTRSTNRSSSNGRPGAYLAQPGYIAERIEGGAAMITPIPDMAMTNTSKQLLPQHSEQEEERPWNPNSCSTSFGLAVADPVQEESNENFQQARQVLDSATMVELDNQAQSASARMRANAKKRKKALIIGGIVAAVLAVGLAMVAIGVAGGFSSSSKDYQSNTSPTKSPTTTTIWSIQTQLEDLVPQETMDRILHEPQSPQALAFDWLLRQHSSSSLNSSLSDARLVQRFTLATLFYSTNGTNWSNNLGWLSTDHECTWHSQTHGWAEISEGMDQLYPDPGTRCNDQDGTYRHLWLSNNNLEGEIPPELYELMTSLQSLALQDNRRLRGKIPSELGASFPNLEALTLGRTEIEGTLPSQLGQATALKLLSTYKTALTGSIPSQFGQLTAMEAMLLHETPNLGGTIPSQIGQLSALRSLYLFRSNLTGTLPSELGRLSSLVQVELHKTQLEGTLPTQLGLLKTTKKLSLARNKLFGAIPSQIGTMRALESLTLHSNSFWGTLPSELGLLTKLTKLRIQQNDEVSGIVPDSICWLTIEHSLSDFRVDKTGIQCPSNCSCTS